MHNGGRQNAPPTPYLKSGSRTLWVRAAAGASLPPGPAPLTGIICRTPEPAVRQKGAAIMIKIAPSILSADFANLQP